MHPFCHLVIKAIRGDPPPCAERQQFAQKLADFRAKTSLTQDDLAAKLGSVDGLCRTGNAASRVQSAGFGARSDQSIVQGRKGGSAIVAASN